MFDMELVRTSVARSLSAAAEQILDVVGTMVATPERQTPPGPEMCPEQWSAVVQKQLLVVADEICRILERMMIKYTTLKMETDVHRTDKLAQSGLGHEKEVPSGHQKCGQSTSPVRKTSVPPQYRDASTETDSEVIHQMQRTEYGTLTMVETDLCGVPPTDQEVLSTKYAEAGSKGNSNEKLKSNKRTLPQRPTQNQGESYSKMCGRPLHKDSTKEKIKIKTKRSQTLGQRCCRVCGKFFCYRRSFLKHVLQHEQSSDQCGVCGNLFDSAESLMEHLQTHNEENGGKNQTDDIRSSAECSDAESDAADSDRDQKQSKDTGSDGENGKATKKATCLQNTNTKIQALNKPKRLKHKDLYPLKYCCKVCGKSFCYRTSFLKHVQEDVSDSDLCGVCGKHFKTEENLRIHLQTYTRMNECEICGRHFDGLKQLEMHMRTHTGEKPFICSICGKAFAQNGNLMGHMRVHTGEKPYVCSVCGQSFSFKEYMMSHMRIHTGEKPFLCSVCGKEFRQRGTLKTHMMIHTGESTHKCVICDKTFYKSGALKIHMRTHTGEKPYLCNVCGKSFASSSSLTKHMGVHEGEQTHDGRDCGAGRLRK
ncbi:hypothetical protein Q5P01_023632 [Channa striata]|uniref:C2H2-type domain-containing protein n=1 Tax=Channa striata TaxID=64152 RepID=A0AA88JAF3_CHASR|nr:hypothetical protein Q5P01_023632 [Channa striata]